MKPGGTCCTAVLSDFPSLGPYRDNFAMQRASTSSAEQLAAYHAAEAHAQGRLRGTDLEVAGSALSMQNIPFSFVTDPTSYFWLWNRTVRDFLAVAG